MEKLVKKYIGDRKFYKQAFAIMAPIVLQQLFLSIAGYVDSLMINSYGGAGFTEAYNGVSAANRMIFVINFLIMGLSAATSIFIAQFYGANNNKKILESFSLSVIVSVSFSVLCFLAMHFFGNAVVDSFIVSDVARNFGYRYLTVMKWGMLFISMNSCLSSAFRSVQQTVLPMIAGIIGILINVFLNYCFIFGNLGMPELDAMGAAIGTVVSRGVEFAILMISVFAWKKSHFKNFLSHFTVDKKLFSSFLRRGMPLVFNELVWSICMVLFAMFYTYKNDVWYSAYGYSQNISDLFFIFFAGMANGTAIILGPVLGTSNFEKAKSYSYKLKFLSVVLGIVMGALIALTSPYIVLMFHPEPVTKQIVINILLATAALMPCYSYNATSFFILRAGGDSVRAFILDQAPSLLFALPLTIVLGVNAVNLGISIVTIFLLSHIVDLFKSFMAYKFVEKGKWLYDLTKKHID